MTTSNQPDAVAARVAALPRLPRDAGGPVFAEPWQAQAFALAVKLSEQGHFTWKEWAAALADELKAADNRGEPDDGTHYYEHWLPRWNGLSSTRALPIGKQCASAKRHGRKLTSILHMVNL